MTRRGLLGVFALMLMIAAPSAVDGQQASPASPPLDEQVKVDVVLSRTQGEKKISRVPYSLFMAFQPTQARTSLRVGVDLQGDPSSTTSKEGVTTTRRESRFVGTSIDCSANVLGSGRYRLFLSIQDSSALPIQQGQVAFRTYSVSNYIIVREGQTVTFSVGTDQVTGETLRAEVTVTVVK